jgi:hypothetical protein
MHGRRLSWLLGGFGLIACCVVGVLRSSVLGAAGATTFLTVVADLIWAGAILVLAAGLHRAESVVARRPLGTAAAAAVALWPLTATLVELLAGPDTPAEARGWAFWGYATALVPLVVGLIAATQVLRARVVPAPWSRAPLWVLVLQTVIWVVPQAIGVASPQALTDMAGLLPALSTLGFLTATLGLGIPAIVLSDRSRAGTVPVYPSAEFE